MIDFIKVGKQIQNLRTSKHLSQDDLASELFVTRQALSRWENGLSLPNIDTLLELSRFFKISFEEILCLNDHFDYNPEDIFSGHDRMLVVNKVISNEIDVNLSDVFYQFSPSERMIVLRAIKNGAYSTDLSELVPKLTISEYKFLGGNVYEVIQKSNN